MARRRGASNGCNKRLRHGYRQARRTRGDTHYNGSPRNISRELIRRLSTNKFIISTNKALEKVVLFRFAEERKTTELLCNYEWWATGYFTEDDIKKYFDTNRIVMRYIGEEKIIL